nr:immunoglobulin heavy chain junction region [Mus musculus]
CVVYYYGSSYGYAMDYW